MTVGVVMLDVAGLALTPYDKALLKNPQVGGLILFSRNYRDREQLMALVTSIRACSPDIVIAVDHEGGRVQRFRDGFTRIPAMQSFLPAYRTAPAATLARVRDVGWLMASELLACGIDISFAPVLDVDDHHCQVIADRAFSPDPSEVVVLAGAFMDGMHEAGMATTGKHFPGHGSVTGDSHLVQPIDDRPLAQVTAHDLIPFARLAPKLDAVMPAHIVFSQVDDQPVGFSAHWLKTVLRGQLNFNGVIFSDDLSMAGAESAGSYAARADAALKAGCDMVLVCNQREAAQEVVQHLSELAQPGSERLPAMRARKRCHWQDLHDNPRWQRMAAELSPETMEG
ncbi:beta-N-acetylhexosaminidase [Simiduia agarivorans]|uniref:Beta-hexosaminidase n=1 Tax=Simiduia agarivorans (strain DSM 21679 / JCM 13881 / BCRC 17597 / SA1) TaxID=1117647 RepID=K4KEU6_SIMAS|nr:beta-N-acetylhexosaminidase [Simiduia agarivorans]AFU97466.1 glycosyl hydrolase [Simiduia agarivorans SA1 = DSM 21679]